MRITTKRTRTTDAAYTFVTLIPLLALLACSRNDGPNPSGTLEATVVDVAPLIEGRVLEVRADEGDTLSRGDTLIVLDTDVIELERERAAAKRGTVRAQHAQARVLLKLAERRRGLAETTLSRTEALVEQGSATRQQLDEATTQRDVAGDEVASARDQLAVLEALDKELVAALAIYDRQIKEGVVTAPIDGTVLVKNLEKGEIAAPGTPGLRLADLSSLELRVYLEAPDLDRVELGRSLNVVVDAMPGETIEGTVSWISSVAEFTPKNVQTRNARAQLVYAVKLRVPNPERRLHVGMPAEVVLTDHEGR